ncbi:MAG TPA: type I-E CRISPR-associated protein Cas7/Cse4/CasC [Chitinispirillaceae bacterium]|nr:type I-E CRISPR-associated protein Cas7/Cse4/CasC [Chitinispirillaceae bacterium]
MKHLELHIIQSVPVACLNRDDLNSPKTAIFGGVQRARVSSQSWKRAIREMSKELAPDFFKGERTRLLYEPLYKALLNADLPESDCEGAAKKIIDELVNLDNKSTDKVRSKTLYFMSPLEIETIGKAYVETKDVKKAIKAVNSNVLKDAADISLFGRMVANDHSLTVEAAAMFSHALSTHKVENEIDFFSAVDDLQPIGESGAGMTSTIEYNSATYYRFAALNLDMLTDEYHLGCMSKAERQNVVSAFIEATIRAIPSARKNTMNGNTVPAFVLCVVREKGHPIQLINAFENPLRTNSGYLDKSIELLNEEYAKLKNNWGITAVFEKNIPELNMPTFIKEVVEHVY